MNKRTEKAFGNKIFLLGKDDQGTLYWLESPSWDCDWYWGFGYIETYTNNKHPEIAKDISSHQHWDGFITGFKDEKNNYVHHLNDKGSNLVETTVSEKESWMLAELMKEFYQLRTTAELFGRGSAHISDPGDEIRELLIDKELVTKINEVLIPAITAKVMEILTPNEDE